MKIIYLYPRTSFKTSLRSDTLWGLLCWGIRYVWGEKILLQILEQFREGQPPFLVSSTFPFKRNESSNELFFPKPILKPFQFSTEEINPEIMNLYKKYKKVTYVPLNIFNSFLAGELEEKAFFLKYQSQWKQYKTLAFNKEIVVHNSINRLSSSTFKEGGLYNNEEFFSPGDMGLFFLIKYYDEQYEKLLSGLWKFFEHMGMGGDTSIGKGSFYFKEEEFNELKSVDTPKSWITLSLYLPSTNERLYYVSKKGQLWYQLEQRMGKVGGKLFTTAHFHKKCLQMFREGSTFPILPEQEFYGQIELVKNVSELKHKVYQYGYAFNLTF